MKEGFKNWEKDNHLEPYWTKKHPTWRVIHHFVTVRCRRLLQQIMSKIVLATVELKWNYESNSRKKNSRLYQHFFNVSFTSFDGTERVMAEVVSTSSIVDLAKSTEIVLHRCNMEEEEEDAIFKRPSFVSVWRARRVNQEEKSFGAGQKRNKLHDAHKTNTKKKKMGKGTDGR